MSVLLCSFSGLSTKYYKIEIDGNILELIDTFRWSDNGGDDWWGNDIPIEGLGNFLNNGFVILFDTINGHTIEDYWEFNAYEEEIVFIPQTDMYWITNTISGLYDAPTDGISGNAGEYMTSPVTAASVSGSGKQGLGGFKFLPTLRIYNVSMPGDYIDGAITFTLA